MTMMTHRSAKFGRCARAGQRAKSSQASGCGKNKTSHFGARNRSQPWLWHTRGELAQCVRHPIVITDVTYIHTEAPPRVCADQEDTRDENAAKDPPSLPRPSPPRPSQSSSHTNLLSLSVSHSLISHASRRRAPSYSCLPHWSKGRTKPTATRASETQQKKGGIPQPRSIFLQQVPNMPPTWLPKRSPNRSKFRCLVGSVF